MLSATTQTLAWWELAVIVIIGPLLVLGFGILAILEDRDLPTWDDGQPWGRFTAPVKRIARYLRTKLPSWCQATPPDRRPWIRNTPLTDAEGHWTGWHTERETDAEHRRWYQVDAEPDTGAKPGTEV